MKDVNKQKQINIYYESVESSKMWELLNEWIENHTLAPRCIGQ